MKQFNDIALRDLGLFLGALALNRLATSFGADTVVREFERPRLAA